MRIGWSTFGVIVASAIAVGANAQVLEPPRIPDAVESTYDRIDPRFDAIRQVIERDGPSSPYFGYDVTVPKHGVPALLRFARPLRVDELERLKSSGVEFRLRDDRPVALGNVYAAFVPFTAVDEVAGMPSLLKAEVAWHPLSARPLEATAQEIGATRAQRRPRLEADGSGAVVATIDSGIDVFHPHFFRADAGAYRWIDTNDNGALDIGVDAVDLNDDGEADGNETLGMLAGAWLDPNGDTVNNDEVLGTDYDWLYADRNRDGERNFGVDDGFTEFDPGYGEPMFVLDDANGTGVADRDEKLLMLGTSKIERYVTASDTWVRGEDLIEAEFPSVAQHGNAVASIVVGGQAPHHRRVGIAPGADIVMYSSYIDSLGDGFDETAQLADLEDAVASGVDVLIHEWTNPYTAPHDGSGNFEAAMTTAREAGVLQVTPTGNLNRSQKHREVDVASGATADFVFVVDGGFQVGAEVRPFSTVYLSLFWRGDQTPAVTLLSPSSEAVAVPFDGSISSIGEEMFQGTESLSERGTHHLVITLWNPDQDISIEQGDWTLRISDTTVADRFIARVADYWSAWSVGVRWKDPTPNFGTAVYPSTADAAFAVGAYAGRHPRADDGSEVGELRNYSGRGPRLDGAPLLDISAPDDPYAALAATERWVEAGYGRTWYRVFGGTSGAAPHVAGAFALMRAAESGLTPAEAETRILESARADLFTAETLPDKAWGAGKLDVYAAVVGEVQRPTNADPEVTLDVVYLDGGEVEVVATVSDADGDGTSLRWDYDYDGEWDTEWDADAAFIGELPDRRQLVRVDVRDSEGGFAGAIAALEPPTMMEPAADMAADAGETSDAADEPEPRRPCGCAAAGEPAGGGFLMLLLFGILRRRTGPLF